MGTYSVGGTPSGVEFDGNNIWVTNNGDGTVTKLLASTGANLGTYTVGAGPIAVAFDGTYMWVANANGSSISKL
jgi:DNA-binding beta-propeller fold protein YncE